MVEPTLSMLQHIWYIFTIVIAPYLTALHELRVETHYYWRHIYRRANKIGSTTHTEVKLYEFAESIRNTDNFSMFAYPESYALQIQ